MQSRTDRSYLEQSTHFYAPETTARFASMRALGMVPADLTLTRVGDDAIEIEITDPRPASMFESVFRQTPLRAGEVISAGVLTVRVQEVGANGWTRARFELEGGLDSACFGYWDGERLLLEPAPPIGEPRTVPHLPGPSGS